MDTSEVTIKFEYSISLGLTKKLPKYPSKKVVYEKYKTLKCKYVDLDEDCDGRYISTFKVSSSYDVYKISLDGSEIYQELIKSFKSIKNAILFSMQQYYMYTNCFPLIPTGIYNKITIGKIIVKVPYLGRKMIDVPKNMENFVGCKDEFYGCPEFIMILSKSHCECHPLDKYNKW